MYSTKTAGIDDVMSQVAENKLDTKENIRIGIKENGLQNQPSDRQKEAFIFRPCPQTRRSRAGPLFGYGVWKSRKRETKDQV